MQIAVILSLILSVWHSMLFFRQSVGISVILFAIPTIFATMYVLEKLGKIKNKKAYILTVPILILSSTYLFFNNTYFNILNIFVILALFASMITWAISDKLKLAHFFEKIFNIIVGPIEFLGKGISIIRDTLFTTSKDKPKIAIFKRILKAIIIAIPILIVILFLLISADDEFAKLFSGLADYIVKIFTNWEILYFILRIALIIILFIYFVSFIYNLTNEKSSYNVIEKVSKTKKIKIDTFTVNTILTVLNVVYLIFTAVQLIHIGDNVSIEKLSETARQGFFQLMVVSIINFVLVIITTMNSSEEGKTAKNYKKIMNIIMIIFTVVILAVSVQKMMLYVNRYGFTYLRIFVLFTLATEALLIIPTIMYIVKEKMNLFYSYLAIIIIMYILLNVVNVDKFIAKQNIDLYFKTGKIDLDYLKDLKSADAKIEIKRLLNNEKNTENLNVEVNNYLYKVENDIKRDIEKNKFTWQSFNFARNRMRKEIEGLNLEHQSYNYKKNKYNYDDNYSYDIDEDFNI